MVIFEVLVIVYTTKMVYRPSVSANVQNAILAHMLDILSGVAEHNLAREQLSKKRRRRCGSQRVHSAKKAKVDPNAASSDPLDLAGNPENQFADEDTADARSIPSVLSAVTVGINEVTKRLESLVKTYRRRVETHPQQGELSNPNHLASVSPSLLVIACRADVNPPMLMSHIPNLVGACNSIGRVNGNDSGRSGRTWLVPMPRGTESTLSSAMGLRRVSILLVEVSVQTSLMLFAVY